MTGASTTKQDLRKPRAGFLLVAFALTLANAAAILTPFEIYPFTSSPMFAVLREKNEDARPAQPSQDVIGRRNRRRSCSTGTAGTKLDDDVARQVPRAHQADLGRKPMRATYESDLGAPIAAAVTGSTQQLDGLEAGKRELFAGSRIFPRCALDELCR